MRDDKPDRAEFAREFAAEAEEAAEASTEAAVTAALTIDELKAEMIELSGVGVDMGIVVAGEMLSVSVTEAETEAGAVTPESVGRPAVDEIWSHGTPKTTAVPPTTSDT